ncbi:putative serine/threonine protein kinase [Golden Marseillevirus]|uniref:putative serine/threonine protein kinase n=1 Tax=Golden Marseillevirus TaxID=1720526 RepID=UPI000877ABCB|nr:putative serine/threonine protein kinase [Golden Marseillevirus]ALX27495.1 putative serine/threonine protein kinase [Golden Marseillevirus]
MSEVPHEIYQEVCSYFPTFFFSEVVQHNDKHSCVMRGEMDGMKVVIKSGDNQTDAQHEAEFAVHFARYRHENVISCYTFEVNDEYSHTVYPDLGMDLTELMHKKRGFSAQEIRSMFYSLLSGLLHISQHGVVHTDVKPANVFVDGEQNLVIGDFGNSFFTDDLGFVETEWETGTLNYRAPDVLLGSTKFTNSFDVWGAGCVLAYMATGKSLFSSRNERALVREMTQILGGFDEREREIIGKSKLWPFTNRSQKKALFFDKLGKQGSDLLQKMLRYTEADRISLVDALAHPYFDE